MEGKDPVGTLSERLNCLSNKLEALARSMRDIEKHLVNDQVSPAVVSLPDGSGAVYATQYQDAVSATQKKLKAICRSVKKAKEVVDELPP